MSSVIDEIRAEGRFANTDAPLTETFRYTVTDADSGEDTKTTAISIDGADDGITISGASLDMGDADLPDGTDTTQPTRTGSLTIDAPAGLKRVKIGDVEAAEGATVTGGGGVLTVTGFDKKTGKLDYSYTLTDASGDATRKFTVTATDADGNKVTGVITVNIADDGPSVTAAATKTVSVAGTTVSRAPDGTATITGKFGTLTVNADGSYSYRAARDAKTGVEKVTFGITDADGNIDGSAVNANLAADVENAEPTPEHEPATDTNSEALVDHDSSPEANRDSAPKLETASEPQPAPEPESDEPKPVNDEALFVKVGDEQATNLLFVPNGKGNGYVIVGGKGNDTLIGGTGDDILFGGEGDDVLMGGGGRDTLIGGAGADTFVLTAAGENNISLISDFSSAEGDRIQLDANKRFNQLMNADGSLREGVLTTVANRQELLDDTSHRVIYNTKNGKLFFRKNNGAAVVVARLVGKPDFSAADIFVATKPS